MRVMYVSVFRASLSELISHRRTHTVLYAFEELRWETQIRKAEMEMRRSSVLSTTEEGLNVLLQQLKHVRLYFQ